MGVAELEKKTYVQCGHCIPGKGCSIYGSRPSSCQTWVCEWLQNESLSDEMRPDRSKVVIDIHTIDKLIANTLTEAKPSATVWEVYRGAALRADVQKVIISLLAQGYEVNVICEDRFDKTTERPTEVDSYQRDPNSRKGYRVTRGVQLVPVDEHHSAVVL